MLELGSKDFNGSVRSFFADASEYIGIDMEPGMGVDMVLNSSQMLEKFGAASFNTIICCETLEHDVAFLETIKQMHIMLRELGMLIITTPTFGFPLHRYPKDYWRFGEDAYREVFFKDLLILKLAFLDDVLGKDLTMAGIAAKPKGYYPPYDDLGNKRTITNAVDCGWSAIEDTVSQD